jgi:DNA-binding phage protein
MKTKAGMAKLADAADLKSQRLYRSSQYLAVNNNLIDMFLRRD